MRFSTHTLLITLLTACLLPSAHAAKEIYFKLEGSDMASDSVPIKWDGWIAGRAFGHHIDHLGGSASRVPTLHQDFRITKHVDKATPMLMHAMTEGQVFPKLTVLYVEQADSEAPVSVILDNVSVISHRVHTESGLSEEIGFAYDSAQFRYTSPNTQQPQTPNRDAMDPFGPDSDADGLPDAYAKAYGLESADDDDDGDGLTNRQELAAGTVPTDRRSRFGIDQITLMQEKPGQGCVTFQTLPGRQYRLLGSATGQKWFELHSLTVPRDDIASSQDIELPFTGLTQLLRVEVSLVSN